MKKYILAAATVLLGSALLLGGCGTDSNTSTRESKNGEIVLKVGATPVPHSEILEKAKTILAKENIDLKIVEFNDYVQPNLALSDKELDANFFQHAPYLEKFNMEHGTDLVAVAKVHIEPMGIYSHKLTSLKDVPNNAKVAIPNDPTNAGRALLLLQKEGLITLKDGGNTTSTVLDITSNPKNLDIKELEAPQLPRSLDDVAFAVINTNYALQADLNPLKDSLAIESSDSPYVNVLVVRKGEENDPAIKKLEAALQSEEITTFVNDKYKGAVVAAH